MRSLLLLGLAVGGAFMAGWFTIDRNEGRTLIEINRDEIRADTRQAIDKGRDLLEKREQERLARQQQSGGTNPAQSPWPAENNWPAQGPWPPQNGTVQGAGYAGPAPYSPQTPYGGQPAYGQQPQYGSGPGFNTTYPAPLNQPPPAIQQPAPRWSEMPPPWQQQTR